ncbi:MAG: hypothetical protein PHP08_00610 [Candidatus Dojkabacteria bacterium]|nr:hypothetical protein [Candidatus Dojkabacteria bacterium]
MAYKTSKKCFFCSEETLTGKKVGKKAICDSCMNDLYEALDLRKFEMEYRNEDD